MPSPRPWKMITAHYLRGQQREEDLFLADDSLVEDHGLCGREDVRDLVEDRVVLTVNQSSAISAGT